MERPKGYEHEVSGETVDRYECSICLMLIKEAVELPCSHCFCKLCVEYNEQYARGSYLCPICQVEYSPENKRENIPLDRIILSLKVKCLQEEKGCEWISSLGNYQDHVDHRCPFVMINCPHNICDYSCLRNSMEEHTRQCEYRSEKCRYCHDEIQHFQLEKHLEKDCSMVPVKCKNQICSCIIPRQQVDEHCEQSCEYEEISCVYKDIGCHAKIFRKDQEVHVKQFINEHMFLMLTNQNKLTEQNQKLEKKIEEMTTQIAEDQNKIEVMTSQLSQNQNKIEKITERLSHGQNKIECLEKKLEDKGKKLHEEMTKKITEESKQNEKKFNDLEKAKVRVEIQVDQLREFSLCTLKLQEIFSCHWKSSSRPSLKRLFQESYCSNPITKKWNELQESIQKMSPSSTEHNVYLDQLTNSIQECSSTLNSNNYSDRFIELVNGMEPNVRYRNGPYRFFKIYSCDSKFLYVRWYSSRPDYEKDVKNSKGGWIQQSINVSSRCNNDVFCICLFTRVQYKTCHLLHSKNENKMVEINNGEIIELAVSQDYRVMDFMILKM